jgi:flagellar biosynthesis protein FlhF
MHIKKFEGRDLKEALARIREELGPEAVILETAAQPRPRRGVSVLAALPREAGALAAAETGPVLGGTNPGGSPLLSATPVTRDRAMAVSRSVSSPASSVMLHRTEPSVPFPTIVSARTVEAEEEMRALRARVEQLNRLVRSDHFSAVPLPLRQLYFDLTDAEVDADLVFRILERMGSAPIPGQFTSAPPGELRAYLASLVRTGGTVESGRRRVIAVVGPTGVGKTTTLAKIAGRACFDHGLSVALVSSDSYRVFGAQHLAAYAALMGLPFFAVGRALELGTLLSGRLADADLVLVDTSGRSPNDPEGIAEIRQLVAACPELDVHLALSASTRARDLALALDAFSGLPIRHLIFTKLDEATSRGGMYTTALKARCPVSWLGTGQEVPDDLEAATPAALTHGLMEGTADGRSGR